MTHHTSSLTGQRGREQGLFTPDDALWRIHRELLAMLAGSRALLLELAHPKIAAGVAQHSDFRRRPLHRLFHTLRVMQRMSFGDADAVQQAARRVQGCHHDVQGELTETTGCYHAGDTYSAQDVELRRWVFATLIDSVLVTYDRFIEPLTDVDRESFYQDSKRMARMFGIHPTAMPQDYAAFAAYVEDMISGGSLLVGNQAREIANALYSHPILGWGLWLVSQPGIGMLPESIRSTYGYQWSAKHERQLERFAALCRWLRAHLPDVLCIQPDAWLGEWQYRRG
jgi:uncharacterized protein (DUF2236 family)